MTKKKFSTHSKTKSQGFRISIYTRVSTEEQAENPEGSIKNQEMRLREFVKLKNMMEPFGEITAVFSDPGVSAKDMNRPGFQRMLKAIKQHETDLVLVTELSRFSRSTKDFANLQDFLEEHGCKFMSIRENFDTNGAAGSMVLSLMASIAEFERKQTAERISQSFLARAKRGLYNGGSVPLGYAIDPKKPGTLVVVPAEAELVKLFFQYFLKEKTLAGAAKAMNAEGIKIPRQVRGGGSARGKNIRFDTVYRILKNKAYLGIRVFQTKSGWEEVSALWDPIIDQVTFDRVQRMLKENCSRRKTHKNKFPFTLSGIIHCKECGERMSGASATSGTGKRIGYYEHLATKKNEASLNYKLLNHKPRRIPAVKLEPVVWDEVKKFILDESFVKNLLGRARAMQGLTGKESKSKELENKRLILDRQVSVLAERIAKLPETIDPKPLIDQLGELQQAQAKLVLDSKNLELSEQDRRLISFENLEIFRCGLKDLIMKGENDLQLRSLIIKIIVYKIEILKDGFEIHFHVGEAHFKAALGDQSPSAAFFVSYGKNMDLKSLKTKKPSGGSPPEGSKNLLDIRSSRLTNGGPDRDRTCDLCTASATLSQLSYRPTNR